MQHRIAALRLMTADGAWFSREAGRKSVVLLKNDNGLLPLKKSQKIALIGPFADDVDNVWGPWTIWGAPERRVSLEAGFRAALVRIDHQKVNGVGADVDDRARLRPIVDGGLSLHSATVSRAAPQRKLWNLSSLGKRNWRLPR